MTIHVFPTTTVGSLRGAFHAEFPRLSLRFFKNAHEKGQGSPLSDMIDDETELSHWIDQGKELDIDQSMTVDEVEKIFEQAGMHVQVFRKSGKLWLETTRTDDWTLERISNEEY
ncbi:MAG: hypothetical protein RL226_1591 [Bacteroidota bacterium]|jgi:hypothetical protein